MQVCPSCGAGLNTAKLNCEYCGADIPKEGGVQYGVFIKEFGIKLQQKMAEDQAEDGNITVYPATISLVNSLQIPAEKDSLVQLTSFLVGQMMSYKNVGMDATRMKGLIGAWVGKGYEVQHKFMLMGTMDTQAQNVVSLLQKTIQDTESNVHKSARNAWWHICSYCSCLFNSLFFKQIRPNKTI